MGPGVLLWVRKPPNSGSAVATHDHWFLVVDTSPPGLVQPATAIHIVGISSHPREPENAVPFNTAGTPLKGECFACLDWELDNYLVVIESDEDEWEYEIRGAQLDRSDPTSNEPWIVELNWFTKTLLPRRHEYHKSRSTKRSRR